jgi:hypothetical protein
VREKMLAAGIHATQRQKRTNLRKNTVMLLSIEELDYNQRYSMELSSMTASAGITVLPGAEKSCSL